MLFIHPIEEIVNVVIYQEDTFSTCYFIGGTIQYYTVVVFHGTFLLNRAVCFYLKFPNAVVHLI